MQNWIWSSDDMESLDAQFDEAKIATGRVRNFAEFDATDWASQWVTTREVPDRAGGRLSDSGATVALHDDTLVDQLPARQGEYITDILTELGYTDGEISARADERLSSNLLRRSVTSGAPILKTLIVGAGPPGGSGVLS